MALATINRLPAPGGVALRERARGLRLSIVLCVGVPTLLAMIYYGLIASDVYIAEAKFTIRGDRAIPSSPVELALFGGGGGEDGLVVREYVLSHGIVAKLDRMVGLRDAYQAEDIDYLQRLPADASHEELTEYFADMVDVVYEPESAVTTLRVRAFRREDAQRIAQVTMNLSERLVNQLSDRVAGDTLSFARGELARAEDRVAAARRALTVYRDRTDALDPTQEAGAILGIVGKLEEKLVQERTQLMEYRSYLREDSARIAATKARIAALRAQIAEERKRLTGDDAGRMSQMVADYEGLQIELEFARKAYTAMLGSLETARAEAQKQQKYLLPVVEPNLPDEALEPRRVLGVLTVFFCSLVVYGIGALLLAAIREHAEV